MGSIGITKDTGPCCGASSSANPGGTAAKEAMACGVVALDVGEADPPRLREVEGIAPVPRHARRGGLGRFRGVAIPCRAIADPERRSGRPQEHDVAPGPSVIESLVVEKCR